MNRVSEILGDKGRAVLEIEAGATVLDAVRQMVDANVGSLLVKHDGEIAGIVSERDYLRRVARHGPTGEEVTVGEIMYLSLRIIRLLWLVGRVRLPYSASVKPGDVGLSRPSRSRASGPRACLRLRSARAAARG